MREDDGANDPPTDADLELARDWITLWQSELAAVGVDREVQEVWRKLIAQWAGAAQAMVTATKLGATAGADERADGRAGPVASPRTAAAPAAPDARDAEIDRLRARIDALERRLADVEPDRTSALDGADRGTGESGLRQS